MTHIRIACTLIDTHTCVIGGYTAHDTRRMYRTLEEVIAMSYPSIDIAFVKGAEETRLKSLEELRNQLVIAEKHGVDREGFRQLFVASVKLLELDTDTVAGIVTTSRPTISRWMSGTAAPHRVGRPSVFRELRKVASEKIRQHSTSAPLAACM